MQQHFYFIVELILTSIGKSTTEDAEACAWNIYATVVADSSQSWMFFLRLRTKLKTCMGSLIFGGCTVGVGVHNRNSLLRPSR